MWVCKGCKKSHREPPSLTPKAGESPDQVIQSILTIEPRQFRRGSFKNSPAQYHRIWAFATVYWLSGDDHALVTPPSHIMGERTNVSANEPSTNSSALHR
jgi:hypothetical protein